MRITQGTKWLATLASRPSTSDRYTCWMKEIDCHPLEYIKRKRAGGGEVHLVLINSMEVPEGMEGCLE